MAQPFAPVLKRTLADDVAQRIRQMIQTGDYRTGDRLPTITQMALQFGVGHPTLREALKKLQTVGVVDIKHGSGVYVRQIHNPLLVSNPVFDGTVSKKLLVDLIDARIPIEVQSVALAARHARREHLREMVQLLKKAEASLADAAVLTTTNMAFHRQIAVASGNSVLPQILEVLSNLFQHQQRLILDIYGSREKDHEEHLEIFEALRNKSEPLAIKRMRAHLHGVREVLLQWDPNDTPIL